MRNSEDLSLWDYIFYFAKDCVATELNQWRDVENIIYIVISIALCCKDYTKTNEYLEKIEFKVKDNETSEFYQRKFFHIIFYIVGSEPNESKYKKDNLIASLLLTSLHSFEEKFAEFIIYIVEANYNNYILAAKSLFKQLIDKASCQDNNTSGGKDIFVLSFNYSLDSFIARDKKIFLYDKENISLKSWRNIHGIAGYQENRDHLPAPIFGIDDSDVVDKKNDVRTLFTKSFRLLDNNVNSLTDNCDYQGADNIVIYGHSLGKADYSYFETIFAECDIYNSLTRLQVYYYPGEKDEFDSIQKAKRYAAQAVVELLTDYGNSLGENGGKNIVNRLLIENRLDFIPTIKYKNAYR